ncbi:hypothetical protein [Anaplasma platys]|uniref:hypothetical protein n=1 Tax=Anaplasma platys TaxID=949 RepID=UPI00145FA984|nr:hypothetical protein [Anaplasma platys]
MPFLKALLCFFAGCLLLVFVLPGDAENSDSPRGWGMDSPFIGVSVSMIPCLVVLLFFTLWMVAFTHFVAHISEFKSFSALVERHAQRGLKDATNDDTIDERPRSAKVVATQTKVEKQKKKKQSALEVMKVMGAVLHHRKLTKRSLAP